MHIALTLACILAERCFAIRDLNPHLENIAHFNTVPPDEGMRILPPFSKNPTKAPVRFFHPRQ